MTPAAYTTQEEFGYMALEGLAFMYKHLEGGRAIPLYTQQQVDQMILAEREACAKFADEYLWHADGGSFSIDVAILGRLNPDSITDDYVRKDVLAAIRSQDSC